MPRLPLDHQEPCLATLGIMLYPGQDDRDQQRARDFTAYALGELVQCQADARACLPEEIPLRLLLNKPGRPDDLDGRWWAGSATGEIVKVYFALANANPEVASWNRAIEVAETTAAHEKVTGSRASLWKARSQFLTVRHLWAAWSIRGRRFQSHPETGYDAWTDFQFFLTESEVIRQQFQRLAPKLPNGRSPIPDDAWHPPDGWSPPARQPNWPLTGVIPDLCIPPDRLPIRKPAGRPPKNR